MEKRTALDSKLQCERTMAVRWMEDCPQEEDMTRFGRLWSVHFCRRIYKDLQEEARKRLMTTDGIIAGILDGHLSLKLYSIGIKSRETCCILRDIESDEDFTDFLIQQNRINMMIDGYVSPKLYNTSLLLGNLYYGLKCLYPSNGVIKVKRGRLKIKYLSIQQDGDRKEE